MIRAFDKAGRCFCDIDVVTPSYFPSCGWHWFATNPIRSQDWRCPPSWVADFAQVAPERNISVVQAADNTLAISVSGTIHNSPPDAFGRIGNRFEVTVQRRMPGTSDDVGWLADTDAGFVITADGAAPQPPVLWSVTVTQPPTPVGEYQLLIEELEPHTSVAGAPAERVVFLETVAL